MDEMRSKLGRMQRPIAGLIRCAWLLCALAAGLHAPHAAAQRTSSLSWVRLPGAEDCIGAQALAQRVEQRLGRPVFVSASQADISLEGRVERVRAPSAVVATLVLSDRAGRELGRRVLRVPGESCQPLEASLVLVIAIAIDPGASLPGVVDGQQQLSNEARAMLEQLDLPEVTAEQLAELAVPEAMPDREPQPSAAQPGPQRSQRADAPTGDAAPHAADDPELALRLGAGLAIELGVLPDPAPAAALELTLAARGFVPVDITLTGSLDQEPAIADGSGRGRLQLFAGGLALCPALPASRTLLLRGCGGARAGVLSVRGDDFAQSYSDPGPWFELVLSAGAWLRFGRFSLHAGAGLGAPLIRDTVEYEDRQGMRQELHRAAAVTGRFELGAGLHF
jgi:hypothetical protein